MVNPDMLPGGATEDEMPRSDEAELKKPEKMVSEPPRRTPVKAEAPADAVRTPAAGSLDRVPEEHGRQVQGVDVNALLKEIRSIGAKI
jgi:hypothetical protein